MSESQNHSEFPALRKQDIPGALQDQVNAVSQHAGIKIQSPVYTNGEVGHPWNELKTLFPERAEAYLRGLRDLGAHEARSKGEDVPVMDRKALLKHRSEILYMNVLDNIMRRHESLRNLTPEEAEEHKELQDWQVDVYQKMLDYVDRQLFKGIAPEGVVQLPTGTGKTVLFSEFVAASGLKSLIVVPNKILLEQTYEELSHIAKHRGITLDIGKFYGDKKKKQKRIGNDVTIAIYNSFSIDAQRELSELQQAGFGLVILDEAHRSLSESRKKALDGITDAIKIGFTATPKFNDERQVANLLGHTIYRMPVQEGVQRELLAPPTETRYIRTSVDLRGMKTKVKDNTEDYDETELASKVNTSGRNQAAVQYYLDAEDVNGKTTVAYCVGVQHAKDLTQEFLQAGVSAAVISGETPDDERVRILEDYRSGRIKVLCNADLLIEGFNEPRASVCINLRPTKSWVIAEQRAGRVLRKDRKNRDKYAVFVEFIDEYEADDPNKPILVKDIYEGAFLSEGELQKRLAGQSMTFAGKAEGQMIRMEDGTQIAYYGNYEKAKHFVPTEKEEETRKTSSWVSEEEMRTLYGLSDSGYGNMFITMKKGYNSTEMRVRHMGTNEQVTEFPIKNYEEALLLQILPVLEELNDKVLADQKNLVSLPKFYKYFSEIIRQDRKEIGCLKDFLEIMADKRKGMLADITDVTRQIESTQFMHRFRQFQNRQLNDKEFQEFRKHTEQLLEYAEHPPASDDTFAFAA